MNDCSCIWVDDYVVPEFYSSVIRKSKKEHTCCECGRVISSNEQYENVYGKWDGNIEEFKTCCDCLSIRNAMFCDGVVHGSIIEDLRNHIDYCNGEISSDVIMKLTPVARRVVLEMIDDEFENSGLWEEDESD